MPTQPKTAIIYVFFIISLAACGHQQYKHSRHIVGSVNDHAPPETQVHLGVGNSNPEKGGPIRGTYCRRC